ncbi:hypothetical protein TIFTF001_052495 [Ficus carica]|uniref:Uncharacterized protein n=1 Tax=Ficus carica TaxID=3494 RepID=A0AA88JHK1_FICCA|nr:hypothetical protein TIFTF001_052495 [Ficus carica]
MDKARGNRPLEENVIIPASINLDESDAKDDKLTSVLRSSRRSMIPTKIERAPSPTMKHRTGVDLQRCRGLEPFQFLSLLD